MKTTNDWTIDADGISADEREWLETSIYGFPTEQEARARVDALLCELGYEFNSHPGVHDVTYTVTRNEGEG